MRKKMKINVAKNKGMKYIGSVIKRDYPRRNYPLGIERKKKDEDKATKRRVLGRHSRRPRDRGRRHPPHPPSGGKTGRRGRSPDTLLRAGARERGALRAHPRGPGSGAPRGVGGVEPPPPGRSASGLSFPPHNHVGRN